MSIHWYAARARPIWSTHRCASPAATGWGASIVRSAMGRCWRCSYWTCAATAGRTPITCKGSREQGAETAFLGQELLVWLKRELHASRATWKVIAADMPIGLHITDGPR